MTVWREIYQDMNRNIVPTSSALCSIDNVDSPPHQPIHVVQHVRTLFSIYFFEKKFLSQKSMIKQKSIHVECPFFFFTVSSSSPFDAQKKKSKFTVRNFSELSHKHKQMSLSLNSFKCAYGKSMRPITDKMFIEMTVACTDSILN